MGGLWGYGVMGCFFDLGGGLRRFFLILGLDPPVDGVMWCIDPGRAEWAALLLCSHLSMQAPWKLWPQGSCLAPTSGTTDPARPDPTLP